MSQRGSILRASLEDAKKGGGRGLHAPRSAAELSVPYHFISVDTQANTGSMCAAARRLATSSLKVSAVHKRCACVRHKVWQASYTSCFTDVDRRDDGFLISVVSHDSCELPG